MSQHIVITGGNRGIGLELATRYSQDESNIVTVLCRQASAELKALDNVHICDNVDVTKTNQIAQALKNLPVSHIDILINNAGIYLNTELANLAAADIDNMNQQWQTNALGPVLVSSACLPLLKPGSKIVNITSRMGSIADNDSGAYYGYRMSKAALNAASKSMSIDLKPKGIAVGIVHPGWIKTDMTNHTGNDTPETAAGQIYERIKALNLDNSGTFWHANGAVLPW